MGLRVARPGVDRQMSRITDARGTRSIPPYNGYINVCFCPTLSVDFSVHLRLYWILENKLMYAFYSRGEVIFVDHAKYIYNHYKYAELPRNVMMKYATN